MPLKVTAAAEPAPRKGGCSSWRAQRKMAQELLPPHLGSSKVQWMNNSLSIRFCPCGWSCSPYCKDMVRVEGRRDVLMPFCSVPTEDTFPCHTGSPIPFQRVIDTSWKQSLPWSQCDKHTKTRTCPSCTPLLLPARPLRTARRAKGNL